MASSDNGATINMFGESNVGDWKPERTKHYPYDCAKPHCQASPERCESAICIAMLDARRQAQRQELGKAVRQNQSLRSTIETIVEAIQTEWPDASGFDADCKDEILYFRESCIDGPLCLGCSVEFYRKTNSAGRRGLSLLRLKLEELKEYLFQRGADEETRSGWKKQPPKKEAGLRANLTSLRLGIEAQEQVLEDGGQRPPVYESERFKIAFTNAQGPLTRRDVLTLPYRGEGQDDNVMKALYIGEQYEHQLSELIQPDHNESKALMKRKRAHEKSEAELPSGGTEPSQADSTEDLITGSQSLPESQTSTEQQANKRVKKPKAAHTDLHTPSVMLVFEAERSPPCAQNAV